MIMGEIRKNAEASLKITYRCGKGEAPLSCSLETQFLRHHQSTSHHFSLRLCSYCIHAGIER